MNPLRFYTAVDAEGVELATCSDLTHAADLAASVEGRVLSVVYEVTESHTVADYRQMTLEVST